jgi:hypothetical protein
MRNKKQVQLLMVSPQQGEHSFSTPLAVGTARSLVTVAGTPITPAARSTRSVLSDDIDGNNKIGEFTGELAGPIYMLQCHGSMKKKKKGVVVIVTLQVRWERI